MSTPLDRAVMVPRADGDDDRIESVAVLPSMVLAVLEEDQLDAITQIVCRERTEARRSDTP